MVDGDPFVGVFALVSLILFWIWTPLGWLGTLLTLWCAYFFRDPPRVKPVREGLVLPPVANYAIGLLKDTSLCSLIGANELMNDAKSIAFAEYQPMAVFVLAAAIYFVMSYPLSLGVRYMEARINLGTSANRRWEQRSSCPARKRFD